MSAIKNRLLLFLLLATLAPTAANAETIAIKAKRVYTSAGKPIKSGIVLIRDGKVVSVGVDLKIPDDARTVAIPNTVVTPGLVEACCLLDSQIQEVSSRRFAVEPDQKNSGQSCKHVADGEPACFLCEYERKLTAKPHPGHVARGCACGNVEYYQKLVDTDFALAGSPRGTWAEHSAEVIPHLRVLDSVNLMSNDFKRLMRGGVTTVYVSPDPASVIGSRGAIVKTAGRFEKRIVNAQAAVKATIGSDPSLRGRPSMPPSRFRVTFMTRRPTTRMGVEWVFRKAFYDARRMRESGAPIGGADTPPAEALPVLNAILDGQIPLRIQARAQNDIFTALRLAKEFGLKFTLDEGSEAFRALPQLKAAGVPVIYGPISFEPRGFRRFTLDADHARLSTPRRLHDEGIEFALTAAELRDEEGLVRQAMMAQRYGLAHNDALNAITAVPAKLLGLAGRVGTLEKGADADLVVWSGDPLAATSRVRLVLINGQVVYDE